MPQRRGPPIFVCMKRHLSAEQRAAYEARRGAFRRLAKAIAAMTPEQRADLARKTIPLSIAGRAFSPYNTILLAMQKPAGTVFGGFRQWIEAESDVARHLPGATFKIHGHDNEAVNVFGWAVSVRHQGEQPGVLEHEAFIRDVMTAMAAAATVAAMTRVRNVTTFEGRNPLRERSG